MTSLFIGECGRKKAYRTMKFANRVKSQCEAQMAQGLRETKPLRVYCCRYCQMYHLTADAVYVNQNAPVEAR